MNDADLKRIADQLFDCLQGREGQCRITHGKPWPWLSLDRDGCIALSGSLLRLASTAIPDGRDSVTVQLANLHQINEAPYDLELFAAQRVLSFDTDRKHDNTEAEFSWRDCLGMTGCVISMLLGGCFLITGVVYWASWLVSMAR